VEQMIVVVLWHQFPKVKLSEARRSPGEAASLALARERVEAPKRAVEEINNEELVPSANGLFLVRKKKDPKRIVKLMRALAFRRDVGVQRAGCRQLGDLIEESLRRGGDARGPGGEIRAAGGIDAAMAAAEAHPAEPSVQEPALRLCFASLFCGGEEDEQGE
jgi:hypothetical protein